MPVYKTFAKRQAESAGKPAIYHYDTLPDTLREQVAQILKGAIGDPTDGIYWAARGRPLPTASWINYRWVSIHDILAREMGVPRLVDAVNPIPWRYMESCLRFVREHEQIDWVLSLIEIAFVIIEQIRVYNDPTEYFAPKQPPDDAIAELNRRFLEHSIGYQYQAGQIIPLDSQYLHHKTAEPAITILHEAVESAVTLLHAPNFSGALQEFEEAHRHYREQRYKEAIASSGCAFESTMKIICDLRDWSDGNKRSTASTLIKVLFNKGLVPSWMESHFTALRATLESGLPTVRNQPGHGTHGTGSTSAEVPGYLAAYCLNLAASNIVFLIETHNAKG